MSTTYQGTPGNVTEPLLASIASSTNATPIVVTTLAAHNVQSGDQVVVQGHTVNTNANSSPNQPWYVTVLSATTFALYSDAARSVGVAGNGVGGANGTVTDLAMTPAFTIPSDGDPPNAASVNVAFQSLADRTQFGWQQGKRAIQQYNVINGQGLGGSLALINAYVARASDDTWTAWSTTTPSGAWATVQNGAAIFTTTAATGATTFTTPVPLVNQGDMLDIAYSIGYVRTGAGSSRSTIAPGVVIGGVNTFPLQGSAYILDGPSSVAKGIHLHGQYYVVSGGVGQTIDFLLGCLGLGASPDVITMAGHRAFYVSHYRPL